MRGSERDIEGRTEREGEAERRWREDIGKEVEIVGEIVGVIVEEVVGQKKCERERESETERKRGMGVTIK